MHRKIRLALVALLALGLAACGGEETGGPASAKADAAKAIQRLYAANKAASTGNSSSSGLGSRYSSEETTTVEGKQGKATVTTTIESNVGTTVTNNITHEILYEDFSSDGTNVFNGSETMVLDQSVGESDVNQVIAMKGDVTMTGEYDTRLVHDVTMTQDISGDSVSMTLTGTVDTDADTFSFSGESFDVSLTVN